MNIQNSKSPKLSASQSGGQCLPEVKLQKRLLEAVSDCRASILFSAQAEVDDPRRWPLLRNQLLRALGDRGLEMRIIEILKRYDADQRA